MRVVALLFTLTALPLDAATVGDAVASRSAEAQTHYDEERYDEALRAYRDALVERPESAALHLNVGDALYQLGDYEGALEEFDRVSVAEDASLAAQGFHNKGNTQFQMQDFGAAVESYREALERSPRDADTKANLELALQLLQQPPPQQQQGGQESDDESDDSQEVEQQQQEQQQDAEDQQPAEPEAGEDEAEGEPPPEQPESTPGENGDEDQEEEGVQAAEDESESMDEEEAEQLLDALRDRDAQSQQRRYRPKRRGDGEHDW